MNESRMKYDSEKVRMDLVELSIIEEIGKVLTYGAKKYAPNTWRTIEDPKNRYFAALIRHLTEYQKGNIIDPESGLHHISHAFCNLYFLVGLEKDELPSNDLMKILDTTLKSKKDFGKLIETTGYSTN